MASFTDTQMPRFNPYIQQQPVEAMAKVGMQKQQAYEEGVQKIQTQIDNIAGLDVVRDVDKAYLQSKMNQLGNSLRTVASGDFSNFQLVNSVGGMTKQVIRDKGVQNAVNSTAKMRKEQEFMEEERKKGELNPANEYVFNKQLGSWIENNDVHQGFNAKYDKFFDVDKFMRETFAAEKPSGFTVDQIFKTDGAGNPIYNPNTGSYELSTTMSRLKKEGLFPEKVQQTLDHVFNDPRVSKQLQINGQYQYRGSTPEDLASRLVSVKESQVNVIDQNIMDKTMKKSMLKDGVEKVKLQKEIDDLIDTKNNTVQNYNSLITNIGDNADAVRGMLYKAEEKNKYKDMYSYVTEERTMHANPAWDANFKMQQEANNMARHKDQMTMEKLKMNQTKELAMLKMDADFRVAQLKTEAAAKTAASAMVTGPIDTPEGLISAFEEKGDAAWTAYTKTSDKLFLESGVVSPALLKINQDKFPKLSKEEVLKVTINAMARKEGKTPEAFRADTYNKALKNLTQNATKLKPEMQALATSVLNSRRVFDDYLSVKKEVEAKTPLASIANLKPMDLTVHSGILDKEGRKITLSREDQMNLAYIYNDMGSWFNSDEEVEMAKTAQAKLASKGFTPYMINSLRYKIKYPEANTLKAFSNEWKSFQAFEKGIGESASREQLQRRADLIKDKSTFNPSVSKSIDTGEKIDKAYRHNLHTYIGRYGTTGNESVGFQGNGEAMSEIALNANKGSVELRANKSDATGEITNTALFYNTKGALVGQMQVSPEEASSMGFDADVKFSSPQKRYVENKIAATGNNSTAYGDVTNMDTYDYADVAFNKNNFPNLAGMKGVDVKANIKATEFINEDGSTSTLYYNYLYINDGVNPRFIKQLDSPVSRVGDAVNGLQNINPQLINQLISEQKKSR